MGTKLPYQRSHEYTGLFFQKVSHSRHKVPSDILDWIYVGCLNETLVEIVLGEGAEAIKNCFRGPWGRHLVDTPALSKELPGLFVCHAQNCMISCDQPNGFLYLSVNF
jgi:hypothetical protein